MRRLASFLSSRQRESFLDLCNDKYRCVAMQNSEPNATTNTELDDLQVPDDARTDTATRRSAARGFGRSSLGLETVVTERPPTPSWTFLSAVDEMMHPRWTLGRLRLSTAFRSIVDHLWPDGHPAKLVHVVGTNGKGTTSRFVEAALGSAGVRSGAIVSPHVFDVRERWWIGGQMADQQLLAHAWHDVVLPALGSLDVDLGFHDVAVLVGLVAFAESGVEIGVVEAGIGARYDRTTALDRHVVVLTGIGDDHRPILGAEHWQRVLNKSAAAVPGMPLLLGEALPDGVWDTYEPRPLVEVVTDSVEATGGLLSLSHNRHYAALAIRAATATGAEINTATALAALEAVRSPGRWQWIDAHTVADIAHDRAAVTALVEALGQIDGFAESTAGPNSWTAVVGVSHDRDAAAVLGPLLTRCSTVVVTQGLPHGRTAEQVAAELAPLIGGDRLVIEPDAASAYAQARAIAGSGPLVITGSAQVVGGAIGGYDDRLVHLDRTAGWRQ